MRNYFKTFITLALILTGIGFSSCFDILEEYHFNSDGSGSAKMIVDVSKMVDMMEAFGSALDSTSEGSESIDEMFDKNESIETLKKLPGISNIVNLNSKENKVIGYSYDFSNIEALNNAIVAGRDNLGLGEMLGTNEMNTESDNENSFSLVKKKFKRVMDMKMDQEEDSENAEYMGMAMMMFKEAKYTTVYSFDRKIKKVKNAAALIGASGKQVTIENSLADLIKGDASNTAEIRLK